VYKYIFISFFVVVVLFLLLRDKNPVVASAEIVANAPIQKVWEIETDLDNWENWNSDIESMEVNGDIGVGTVFVWKAGGITIESTITEYEPNTRIAWKGKTFGIEAYHVWNFTERGEATYINTEERFTGILPWLLPGTMRDQIDKALKHGVQVLKNAAENKSPNNAN
jgi:uncharacterized membrane protein